MADDYIVRAVSVFHSSDQSNFTMEAIVIGGVSSRPCTTLCVLPSVTKDRLRHFAFR